MRKLLEEMHTPKPGFLQILFCLYISLICRSVNGSGRVRLYYFIIFLIQFKPDPIKFGLKILIHTQPDGSRIDPTRHV
jgi:hypothetical protein